MHGDGFGCLHTEDISGHKIEGLPFFAKKHPPLHICPARCDCKFEGVTSFMGEEVEDTTKSAPKDASTRSVGTLHVA